MPALTCPHCAAAVQIANEAAGAVVLCPFCRGPLPQPEPLPDDNELLKDPVAPDYAPLDLTVRRKKMIAGWWGLAGSFLSLLPLGLFFLPMVVVGKHISWDRELLMFRQSGFQAASGKMSWFLGQESPAELDEKLTPAFLMIVYPAVLLVGLIIGLVPISPGMRFGIAFLSCAAAAGLLLAQMIVGFPSADLLSAELDGLGASSIRAHYTMWMGMAFVCQSLGILLAGVDYFVAKRR